MPILGRSIFTMGLVMLLFATECPPASAAVRVCKAVVSSEVVQDKDETTAKKKALEQWTAKASALGPGFGLWRIAAEKALQCFPKDGQFECVALGAPCIIQNNPAQRPAGPDGKGQPL